MSLTRVDQLSRLDPSWVGTGPRGRRLPDGWPLWLTVGAYPVAWALGIKLFVWPLVALALVGWLVRHRSTGLVVPRGFLLWAAFIGWSCVSVLMVHSTGHLFAWVYRESLYLTGTVVLLFCVNVTPREVPTWRFARAFALLFGSTVVLGTVGVLIPNLALTTPVEILLPRSMEQIGFIAEQVQARTGATAAFIGAVRPVAPYGYTNEWGAATGVLWPLAMYSSHHLRTRRARMALRMLLAFSIVPIVLSVNRGLWISLIVALLVVMWRSVLSNHLRTTAYALVASAVGCLVIVVSPLEGVIQHRLTKANLGTRETLVSSALNLAHQSPVFGYGTPQTVDVANTNDVSVGTHGQLYTLLVSHGLPGAGFYVAFFIAALVITRRVKGPAIWAWAAMVVSVVQLTFYNSIPMPLVLAMMAFSCCLRDLGWTGSPPPTDPHLITEWVHT